MTNSIVQQSVSSLLDAWLLAEKSGNKFPVPFDIAWPMAGYSNKANAKRSLVASLKKGHHYSSELMKKPARGRSSELIQFSLDGFKHFCLMAETQEGDSIRQYFIEAEKVLQQIKAHQKYPNQITGQIPSDPSSELAKKVDSIFDIIFSRIPDEIRTGMKIEAMCNVDPTLRPMLEPFKPKLLLEAELLSPTAIGKILEERTGQKHSGQAVNKLLVAKNLQKTTGAAKGLQWEAIGQGIEFSKVVADTAAGHGKTVQSLRWYASVVDLLIEGE
jgi:hypothetical protein